MTPKQQHEILDLLVGLFIADTGRLPSKSSIMDLAEWSCKRVVEHSERREGDPVMVDLQDLGETLLKATLGNMAAVVLAAVRFNKLRPEEKKEKEKEKPN